MKLFLDAASIINKPSIFLKEIILPFYFSYEVLIENRQIPYYLFDNYFTLICNVQLTKLWCNLYPTNSAAICNEFHMLDNYVFYIIFIVLIMYNNKVHIRKRSISIIIRISLVILYFFKIIIICCVVKIINCEDNQLNIW